MIDGGVYPVLRSSAVRFLHPLSRSFPSLSISTCLRVCRRMPNTRPDYHDDDAKKWIHAFMSMTPLGLLWQKSRGGKTSPPGQYPPFLGYFTPWLLLVTCNKHRRCQDFRCEGVILRLGELKGSVNPLNPKYFYIVHSAGPSIFPTFLLFFGVFSIPTIVGVRPQLTECGHYYSRGMSRTADVVRLLQ